MSNQVAIPFKDFITLQRGFDLPRKDMKEGEYPVLGSTSIIGYHNIYKVEPPGVTTGRSGSLGFVIYIDKRFWPHNTSLWVKDFKNNIPRYVYYYLQTLNLERYNSGVGVPTLNRNDLDNLVVRVHSLSEQHKIAAILSAYDDLIENNTKRIKILEEMAQTIYNEWFVKFKFPGHENVKMVDSELGMIPEGWEVRPFSDMVFINPKEKVLQDTEKPYVPMECLLTNSMLVTSKEIRQSTSGAKFKNDDTLFARITPCLENGKTGFVQFLPDNNSIGVGSTEFIVLRSKTLCPECVYLLSRTDKFRENAIKSMVGASGRQRVKVECFDNYLLPQPDEKTLSRFSDIVRPMFKEIFMLDSKNYILKSTRDLLLPRLISGEVDVSELDINVEGITA